jgi:hypothetical protein
MKVNSSLQFALAGAATAKANEAVAIYTFVDGALLGRWCTLAQIRCLLSAALVR